MNKYENVAQDSEGNVIENATVTVKEYPGGANATIYSANSTAGGNVNGFLTGEDGSFEFFAANGRYNVEISKAGRTTKINYNILIQDLSSSDGSSLVGFLQSGTGAVSRSVQAKERDIFSKADFGSLAQAITAASAGVVLEPATGQLWLLGGVNPTFDEASDVVARCLGFDTGATLTIPASKQFDAIAWGDTGSNQVFSIGSAGIGALMRFNLESAAASHATSNLYGVIGAITNLGPGITKPINVRAIAGSGCTGVVIGAVIGANSRTGSTAYGMQMTFDTDTSGTIVAGIWQTSNTATTAKLDYGLLLDDVAIQAGGAGFQLRAKGTGDFVRLNNSAASVTLFVVSSTGQTTITSASLSQALLALTYSASIAVDAALANTFTITPNNGTAFTINSPTNPTPGQLITLSIVNSTGGALGAVTWGGAFKMTAWTQPANGFSRSIDFFYNGISWIEKSRTAADVPN